MTPRENEILEPIEGKIELEWKPHNKKKFYAETNKGVFLYWEEKQEQNPSTIYGE